MWLNGLASESTGLATGQAAASPSTMAKVSLAVSIGRGLPMKEPDFGSQPFLSRRDRHLFPSDVGGPLQTSFSKFSSLKL